MRLTDKVRQRSVRFLAGAAIAAAAVPAAHAQPSSAELRAQAAQLQADGKTIAEAVARDRPGEAEAALRRSLAWYDANGKARDPATADLAVLLALALNQTERSAEAEPFAVRAEAAYRAAGKPLEAAKAATLLSDIALARNDFAPAEAAARRALTLAAGETPPGEVQAMAQRALGSALSLQRRYGEAELAFRQALSLMRATFGEDHPRTQLARNNLATAQMDRGQFAEAEATYRESLARGGGTPRSRVNALARLAEATLESKRPAESERLAREALELERTSFGASTSQAFNIREVLANALAMQGKRDEALALAQETATARAALPETSVYDLVADQGRIGHILNRTGKPAEAIPYFTKAVEIARTRLGPDEPLLAQGLLELAVAKVQVSGKPDEAWPELGQAVAIVSDRRTQSLAAGSQRAKRDSAAASRELDRALGQSRIDEHQIRTTLTVAMELYRLRAVVTPARTAEVRAANFRLAQDLSRSRAARAMAQTRARTAAGSGPLAKLVAERQALEEEAVQTHTALADVSATTQAEEARLRGRYEEIGRRLATVGAELARRFPAYERLIDPDPLSEDAVAKRLGKDEALLFIVDDGQKVESFAIAPGGRISAVAKASSEDIAKLVGGLRCQMDEAACPPGGTASGAFDAGAAHRLYAELIAPVASVLEPARRLYVATSGNLTGLPLAMLVTAPPEAAAAPAWLGDRFAIVNLPSVAALALPAAPRRGRMRGGFVGFGDPALGPAADTRSGAGKPTPAAAVANGADPTDPAMLRQLPSLPGTRVELAAMAGLFGAARSETVTGAAATEAKLKADPAVERASVLALATHGLLPMELGTNREPGLVFTPPTQAGSADDGLLTASEAASLKLSALWVVLSACNTATGVSTPSGDGLSDLARGFLFAGAGSLLASHWRVADDATAALTVETLRAWRAGKLGKAEALQAGMRAVRTGKRGDGSALAGWTADWAHPAIWASFTLIADRGD